MCEIGGGGSASVRGARWVGVKAVGGGKAWGGWLGIVSLKLMKDKRLRGTRGCGVSEVMRLSSFS